MPATSGNLARFFHHSGVYALGNIINRVGAFLLLPLYTNYLSVAEYGSLELFYTVSSIVSGLLSVGIAHATLRFYYEFESDADRHKLVRTSFFAILGLGSIGALIVGLFSEPFTAAFFESNDYRWGLPLILLTMVFELGSQVCLAYIRATERSMFFVGLALAKLVLQVALNALLVAKYHAGVEGVLLGNLVAVFAGWLILSIFTLKHCGIGFDRTKLIPVLKYSAPFLFSTVLGLISGNIDRVLIGTRISLAALGTYALATKFSQLLTELVAEPFNRSYGAFRFSIMGKPGASEMQERITRYFTLGLLAAGLGIALFTRELLMLTSQSQFWDAARYTPLLVIVAIVRAVAYPIQTGVLYGKRTTQLFYTKCLSTAICVPLIYAFIGPFGIGGVCVAILISSLAELMITDYWSQRIFQVSYHWWRVGIAGLLATVLYLLALYLEPSHIWLAVLVKSFVWFTFIALVAASPALHRDEVRGAQTFVTGMLQKVLRRAPAPAS
ncbi:MAG TPA: oligosaccharide flippase family protein [Steroidobacteraceae bacterium]|nr:oligosaccharide flippase family protein [Steroidobacteraceae bacterium]